MNNSISSHDAISSPDESTQSKEATQAAGRSVPPLSEEASLEEIQSYFSNDRFATKACGARIVKASKGYALCEFDISPDHINANGGLMGGAIFTLADFALAIACNVGEPLTVAVNNTIEFFNTAKGARLIAECKTDKSGTSLGFYTVDVSDEVGTKVARMTATCFRR